MIAPAGSGFGTTLITAVGGGDPRAVSVDWRPEGVIWTLRLSEGVSPHQAPDKPQPAEAAPAPCRAQSLGESRILLVEDEPLVALDLRHELEDAGAEVVGIARTVPEALEMAGQVEVDLAILDGNLKGQPVDEVADRLSRDGVRFCFLSGYGREHLPRGHDDAPLIEKPFRPDHLRSVLNDLLAAPSATAAE